MRKTIRRKRSKKNKRKTRKSGNKKKGGANRINISYGTTLIKADENLKGKAQLYNQKPTINYNPRPDITYLITMTDPDAPDGKQGNSTQGKHTWTHYVATLKANKIIKEFYPYQPPTPPPNTGVHRYIFKAYLYDATDESKLNNTATGNAYYKQIEPVIKNKVLLDSFQYKVSSLTQ